MKEDLIFSPAFIEKGMEKSMIDVIIIVPRREVKNKGIQFVNSCLQAVTSPEDLEKLPAWCTYTCQEWYHNVDHINTWNVAD